MLTVVTSTPSFIAASLRTLPRWEVYAPCPAHAPTAVRYEATSSTNETMTGAGFTDRFLNADETREIVRASLDSLHLAGKRVLFIIPDGTRTMPMPLFFGLF